MNHTKGQVYPDGTVAYYKDEKAREMISTDYDSTASYAVGDYCMYDNVRYCCNTAIASGGETWNSAHWDVAKVDDDVTAIKQSLSQLQGLTVYRDLTPIDDYAEFDDGSTLPLISLTSTIEYTQSGSGTPSPSNPRPISGHSAINVVVSPNSDFSDGTTYTVNFVDGGNPLIVYGGVLDVVSGVLTVDDAYVDLGALSWVYDGDGVFRTTTLNSSKLDGKSICSNYTQVTTSWSNVTDGKYRIGTNAMRICDTNYTDATTFTIAMNGVQLVYELQTPQTYQLTPTEVDSLLGQNYINSDVGVITNVKYLGVINLS